jgi:hypothetical protein
MIQSVEDGMSSAEDTFPKIESSVTAPSQQAHGAVPERGGEQMATTPDDESHATGSPPDASPSSDAVEVSAAADDSKPLRDAYKAGQEAKAAGQRRSALPGDFRNAAHDKEAQAWLRGHDGKPF